MSSRQEIELVKVSPNVMDDQELNLNLLGMVRQERKMTSQILDYLKEVEDRKLFAKRGYPSLFSYCTDFLGYSESAAQRRISSMRLLREVPQIQEKIISGELNLSNVSKAASFFRQEQKTNNKVYTSKEKEKVLESLAGKTQRETEIELVKVSPKVFETMDSVRIVTEEITELRFTLDQKTTKKLERLKELKPNLSTQELLDWMLTRCLKQVDPLEKIKTKNKNPVKKPLPLRQYKKAQPLRRNFKVSVRRQVWQQANGKCQFKDHQTSQDCKSLVGLEVDHIQPLALGGNDQVENLRLLCREHHKLFTSQSFSNK